MRLGRLLLGMSMLCALPSSVAAQVVPPPPSASTLLVLDPMGVDPATAAAIQSTLVQQASSAGYHVVTPGPGSVVGALDPVSGTALVGVVQRTGVQRAVGVWIVQLGAGFDVHVGLASHDGIATSLHVSAPPTDLAGAAARALAVLLPAPSATATGVWGGIAASTAAPVASGAPVMITVPASPALTATPPLASPAPRRHHEDRPTGLLIGGAAMLGGGWIAGLLIGVFGGYHDCSFGCSGSTSWDPAWDTFRAVSFVPVLGPWLQLGLKPDSRDEWPIWLVADGILQGAGAIMLIAGIVMFDSWRPSPEDADDPSITLLPTMSPTQLGLSAIGNF